MEFTKGDIVQVLDDDIEGEIVEIEGDILILFVKINSLSFI